MAASSLRAARPRLPDDGQRACRTVATWHASPDARSRRPAPDPSSQIRSPTKILSSWRNPPAPETSAHGQWVVSHFADSRSFPLLVIRMPYSPLPIVASALATLFIGCSGGGSSSSNPGSGGAPGGAASGAASGSAGLGSGGTANGVGGQAAAGATATSGAGGASNASGG